MVLTVVGFNGRWVWWCKKLHIVSVTIIIIDLLFLSTYEGDFVNACDATFKRRVLSIISKALAQSKVVWISSNVAEKSTGSSTASHSQGSSGGVWQNRVSGLIDASLASITLLACSKLTWAPTNFIISRSTEKVLNEIPSKYTNWGRASKNVFRYVLSSHTAWWNLEKQNREAV